MTKNIKFSHLKKLRSLMARILSKSRVEGFSIFVEPETAKYMAGERQNMLNTDIQGKIR